MSKTPLEVIREGEREFRHKFEGANIMLDNCLSTGLINSQVETVTAQTLALLQAQIAELEGRLITIPNGESCNHKYNQAIQDQIDSIEALIKEVTK